MLLGNESLRHTHPELALQLRMFGSPAAVGSLCPAAQAALAEIWQSTQLLSSLCVFVCVRVRVYCTCARVCVWCRSHAVFRDVRYRIWMFYLQYVKEQEEEQEDDEEEEFGGEYFEVPLKKNDDDDLVLFFVFLYQALFVIYPAEFTALTCKCLFASVFNLQTPPSPCDPLSPLPFPPAQPRSNCKCIGQVDVRSFSLVDMTPITIINDNKN